MNQRGQMMNIVIAGALLVTTGIIGLTILDDTAQTIYQATVVAPDGFTYVADAWEALNESNIRIEEPSICGNTTNSSWIENTDWNMSRTTGHVNITITSGDAHCNYSYGAEGYSTDSAQRTVMENVPVIFALGLLGLAATWIAF